MSAESNLAENTQKNKNSLLNYFFNWNWKFNVEQYFEIVFIYHNLSILRVQF